MYVALLEQPVYEQLHPMKQIAAMVVIATSGYDTQVGMIEIQGDLRLISATSVNHIFR